MLPRGGRLLRNRKKKRPSCFLEKYHYNFHEEKTISLIIIFERISARSKKKKKKRFKLFFPSLPQESLKFGGLY
jgi:hypothetical protein